MIEIGDQHVPPGVCTRPKRFSEFGCGGLAAVTPLIVAWYLTWRGWYLAALAVVIVAALVGLAVSARSLQWRS